MDLDEDVHADARGDQPQRQEPLRRRIRLRLAVEPIPEWKGVTRLTWTTGPVGVSLRHRYVASGDDDRWVLPESAGLGPNPAALQTYTNPRFPAYHYLDLSGTFAIGRQGRHHAGVNNITDKDPPIVAGFGELRKHVPVDV